MTADSIPNDNIHDLRSSILLYETNEVGMEERCFSRSFLLLILQQQRLPDLFLVGLLRSLLMTYYLFWSDDMHTPGTILPYPYVCVVA